MVTDPYSVLGIEKGAGKDEIKAAYRKKARECHPDMHPNDPYATEKMNEVNEAYDMLCNPHKYKNVESTDSYRNENGYRNTYAYANEQNRNNTDRSYYDSVFGEMFGFGQSRQNISRPQKQSYDSEEIRSAIDFINVGRYEAANRILNQIVSGRRDGRWHYLSAVAHCGLGNQIRAMEEINMALQMEPNNLTYKQVYSSLNATHRQYEADGQDFQRYAQGIQKMCMSFCAAQFFCMFCRCF